MQLLTLCTAYASPELFVKYLTSQQWCLGTYAYEIDKAADIYAFAIVLWALMSRKAPWPDENGKSLPTDTIKSCVVAGERPPISEAMSSEYPSILVALTQRCWLSDPYARPHFSQVESFLSEQRQTEQ